MRLQAKRRSSAGACRVLHAGDAEGFSASARPRTGMSRSRAPAPLCGPVAGFPPAGTWFRCSLLQTALFLPFSGMLKRAGAQCRRRKSPEKRAAREQGRQGRFGISDAGRRFSFRHASAACASYAGEGEYACAKDVLCRKYALHLSDIRGRVPVLFTGSNAQPTFPACFSREEKLRAPERSMLQQDL